MPTGQCGEEFWIADELWMLAHQQPRNREAFTRAVGRLVRAGSPTQRKPYKSRADDRISEQNQANR